MVCAAARDINTPTAPFLPYIGPMVPAQKDILAANLDRVHGRIKAAAARVGRDPATVTLVAVTKSVGPQVVQALIELGQQDIGENRLQDAMKRFANVPNLHLARRHFIGHLQRNKVKGVLEQFDTVHSLDSTDLAREIDKRAAAPVECFIEVNSGEAAKHGIAHAEVTDLLRVLRPLPNIKPVGLMTMAPAGEPEAARSHFARLADLLARLRQSGLAPPGFDRLSMGMSGDFEVAIECGATHIRVGTTLFQGLEP